MAMACAPKAADPVDRHGWNGHRQTRADRGLPRRVHPVPCLHDIAHDHGVDHFRRKARTAQGLTDGDGPSSVAGVPFSVPFRPDRGADGMGDDDLRCGPGDFSVRSGDMRGGLARGGACGRADGVEAGKLI
jgi:hypothetical protein